MGDRDAGSKGIGEELAGTAKKVAGRLVGDDDLESAGQAQQDKADAEREAAEAEQQAEAKRREAIDHEVERKRHEQS